MNDLNYLFHRQQVERTRAEVADNPEARTAHQELAQRYEARINRATDGDFQFPDADETDRSAIKDEESAPPFVRLD